MVRSPATPNITRIYSIIAKENAVAILFINFPQTIIEMKFQTSPIIDVSEPMLLSSMKPSGIPEKSYAPSDRSPFSSNSSEYYTGFTQNDHPGRIPFTTQFPMSLTTPGIEKDSRNSFSYQDSPDQQIKEQLAILQKEILEVSGKLAENDRQLANKRIENEHLMESVTALHHRIRMKKAARKDQKCGCCKNTECVLL